MINLDELKPILEPLLEGREDAATVIESIASLDKPVEVDRSEIDALNASWNDRFKAAFFGAKAADLDGEPTDYSSSGSDGAEGTEGQADSEEVTGENITIDDLFNENIVE